MPKILLVSGRFSGLFEVLSSGRAFCSGGPHLFNWLALSLLTLYTFLLFMDIGVQTVFH